MLLDVANTMLQLLLFYANISPLDEMFSADMLICIAWRQKI